MNRDKCLELLFQGRELILDIPRKHGGYVYLFDPISQEVYRRHFETKRNLRYWKHFPTRSYFFPILRRFFWPWEWTLAEMEANIKVIGNNSMKYFVKKG